MWHKKYFYSYTKYFGKFACHICSKILGIGLAERNWGEVVHLKTEKHSHLSAKQTNKQAIIFGSGYCHFIISYLFLFYIFW